MLVRVVKAFTERESILEALMLILSYPEECRPQLDVYYKMKTLKVTNSGEFLESRDMVSYNTILEKRHENCDVFLFRSVVSGVRCALLIDQICMVDVLVEEEE